jgi:hypothetical protein
MDGHEKQTNMQADSPWGKFRAASVTRCDRKYDRVDRQHRVQI